MIVCNPREKLGGIADKIKISQFGVQNIVHAVGGNVRVDFFKEGDNYGANLELTNEKSGTWFGLSANPEVLTEATEAEIKRNTLLKLKEVQKRGRNGEFFETSFIVGTSHNALWNEIRIGKTPKLDSEDFVRGYLMIDPQDIPEVVDKLIALGKKRASMGKYIDFKWLLSAHDMSDLVTGDQIAALFKQPENYSHTGEYDKLKPAENRIVVYADTVDEIKEILQELHQSGWDKYERRRINKFRGAAYTPRRPGTSQFKYVDDKGKTIQVRSMNHLEGTGFSESKAQDANWRDHAFGAHTLRRP